MIKPTLLYQVLGYAGLLPFLVATYLTWCGPMQDIIYAAELFTIYSIAVLCFLAGSWWGYSFADANGSESKLLIASCAYALVATGSWLLGYLPATIIVLGVGYVAVWLQEFFIHGPVGQGAYRTMRSILTLTVFVCHLLVAMQIYTL